jgi:hypothetical protein
MTRDFHHTPFDEATCAKLGLFRDYITEWLPVWLSQARPSVPITIVDFFAGPGRDATGKDGSPLIAITQLRVFSSLIKARSAKVQLFLNEHSKAKAAELRAALAAQDLPPGLCTYEIHNLDFAEAFALLYPRLCQGPSLLILDQQGMKQISDEIFKKILTLSRADFVFFIASSFIRRFESHPVFQKYLKIPPGAVTSAAFNDTHRAVTRYYQDLATQDGGDYFVGQFSIKKGSNLYGLIFGSHHPLGLEKFLAACWKVDPERGEANFDIDDDQIDLNTPHLFAEMDRPLKLTLFQDALRSRILSGELKTDGDVYLDSLREGFLPAHGRAVLREIIKEKSVRVSGGQARVSKDGYQNPRAIEVVADGSV